MYAEGIGHGGHKRYWVGKELMQHGTYDNLSNSTMIFEDK